MGLKPNPFDGGGYIVSKGLDVRKVKKRNPNVISAWISNVFKIKIEFFLSINLNIKKLNKVKTSIHKSIDPS